MMKFNPLSLTRYWRNKSFGRYNSTIALIAIIAVAIRLVHAFAITYRPLSDMHVYLKYSGLLLDRDSGVSTTLFPPGYMWFLWLFQLVASIPTPLPIQICQAFLNGGTLILVAAIARSCYGARTAITAACAYALYKTAVLSTGVMMSEIFAEFFLVASVLSFICYLKHQRLWMLLICAAMISLATHTRVNLLVVFVVYTVLLGYAIWSSPHGRMLKANHVAIFITLVIVSLIPWSLRNSRLLGHPTFISSNDGMNLLQGNNADTDGGWFQLENISGPRIKQIDNLPFTERSRHYKDFAVEFIVSHPVYELFFLVPQRFHYIYLADQIFWPWGQAFDSNYSSHPFGPWVKIPLIPFNVVFVLGLIGFCIPGKSNGKFLLPMLWLVILVPLLMVHGNGRFHYVSDFLLLISGSAVISRIVPTRRQSFYFKSIGAAVLLFTGISSVIQYARFGGGSLLPANLAGVMDNTKSGDTQITRSLFEVPVQPGKASHLLLSADVAVETDDTNILSPNILVTFYDDNNVTVTMPYHATELLPSNVHINPNVGFEHIWRILLVPGSAKSVRLVYTQQHRAKVSMKNLKLTGPLWQ